MWPFTRKPDTTSSKIATIASRGLKYPLSLTQQEIRSLCASALNQAANKA